MTPYEYGSVLVSIVVGLGIARVLGGIAAFLGTHRRAAHDWIAASWCLVLLLNLMSWWVAGWSALRAPEIRPVALLVWTIATAFLYLSACLLVPGRTVEGSGDLQTRFELPPKAFFACLGAHFSISLVFVIVNPPPAARTVGPLFLVGALAVISGAGIAVKTNRGHALLLAAFALSMAALMGTIQVIG